MVDEIVSIGSKPCQTEPPGSKLNGVAMPAKLAIQQPIDRFEASDWGILECAYSHFLQCDGISRMNAAWLWNPIRQQSNFMAHVGNGSYREEELSNEY